VARELKNNSDALAIDQNRGRVATLSIGGRVPSAPSRALGTQKKIRTRGTGMRSKPHPSRLESRGASAVCSENAVMSTR